MCQTVTQKSNMLADDDARFEFIADDKLHF